MSTLNSYGEVLRQCVKCKCLILESKYFSKNRKGEYKSTCNICLTKQMAKRTKKKEAILVQCPRPQVIINKKTDIELLEYYRHEYGKFTGTNTEDTSYKLFTLKEQIDRYSLKLAFWYIKIDELKQKEPNELKDKDEINFVKAQALETIKRINDLFPSDAVQEIQSNANIKRMNHDKCAEAET